MIIDTDQLFKCETCFHKGPLGCKVWCDAGESYRPAASKLKPFEFNFEDPGLHILEDEDSETGHSYEFRVSINGEPYSAGAPITEEFFKKLGYEKVVKGQWIDGAFDNSKRCSVCGKYATKIHNYDQPVFDYKSCPYCHAIMEEFEE